jgi:hypothetical protein|uniref:VWFA domain-containing protein n=1 Tax=Eutreptiella gymnastica TaxID=73025 RepID=A0A7S4LBR0_9EUGL|eukprot:CAMPEP_0174287442 /NCGR_PEP_ID=MMETSP0809-20121228/16101_1 /TAXON_ID=73025 ORGANISM="Eutreptiella gymnastica-like, Strain CCMP1594" /NCGR_SAMPLE_ID=MMETSP0809 /ASSEMBLY_ACC=CAM_ASM_000658 /LENGTH=567 /DNA_ID=CAMNT_0015384003 /DNA_START=28 /DNA_END=1731 /DNA_ORIENTATION=-
MANRSCWVACFLLLWILQATAGLFPGVDSDKIGDLLSNFQQEVQQGIDELKIVQIQGRTAKDIVEKLYADNKPFLQFKDVNGEKVVEKITNAFDEDVKYEYSVGSQIFKVLKGNDAIPPERVAEGSDITVEIPAPGLTAGNKLSMGLGTQAKKVALTVMKDVDDLVKFTGRQITLPPGAKPLGVFVSINRYLENGEFATDQATFKMCGFNTKQMAGMVRCEDGKSQCQPLLADQSADAVIDVEEPNCLVITSKTSSFAATFYGADAPCPLDLLIVAGLPSKNSQVWDDGTQSLGLTPADFEEVKKYLRARVDTFLTKHPGYYIGILQYANAQQIACPMSNDKQALFACIDGNPYDNDIANGNTLTLQTVNGQPSAEIGTLPAMLLATEHLKAFFKKRRLSEDRQVYEYAVELVIPGDSADQQNKYNPLALWFTYAILPPSAGIRRFLAVNFKNTGDALDPNKPIQELIDFQPSFTATHWIQPITAMEHYGREIIRLCPDDDCDLSGGKYETFFCPYESILMEHCYRCVEMVDGDQMEIVVCDGWSEAEIRAQCESPVPIASPSPATD